MNKILSVLLLFLFAQLNSQDVTLDILQSKLIDLHLVENGNSNFDGYERFKEEVGNAQIVMLGEQSHGDATTFETKIKLIKYLHQEMGFEVLAFESDFYGCHKAWSMMQQGHDVKDAFAKGIIDIWSVLEELNPLYDYFAHAIDHERPLMLAGFDSQLSGDLGIRRSFCK